MSGAIDVRKIDANDKRKIKEFIKLPWKTKIYENDSAWVPPLIGEQKKLFNPDKGYFYDIGEVQYFMAYRDDQPVGRITAHINHLYEEEYDKDTGFFGFFECIEDQDVANALFSAAEEWLKEKGKTKIQGPQSFSIYDAVGFEVQGEDIMPVVGLFHTAPFFRTLAEKYGFEKKIDWYCFLVKKIDDFKPYLKDVRENIMKDQDVTYNYLDKKEIANRA